MKAEIITIGDEILIGQVIDTNSAWMGQQLSFSGISVTQITSVSDNEQHILTALKEAEKRADLILITGGLGPTKDDITKNTLCKYFNTSLVFSDEAYKDVERLFHSRGKEVTPINRKQAEVPANCKVIRNINGTAPAMWFETNGKVFVSMPGVPYEMKAIMKEEVLPLLKQKFQLPHIYHKSVLTQGIGESFLSELISKWEDSLVAINIKLAYLPSAGKVRLRLSTSGKNREELVKNVEQKIKELQPLIAEHIYGYELFGEEPESLEKLVGILLKEQNKTLAIAESCTGGYISQLITSIAGSSAYFKGSVVAYANEIKAEILSVNETDILTYGAVSKQVVEQMAVGVQKKLGSNYSIATSGIAGPDGGSVEKPVGTVWIAVAGPNGVMSENFQLGEHRGRIIERASITALNMLRKLLTSTSPVGEGAGG